MRNKILSSLLLLVFCAAAFAQTVQKPDYSTLTSRNHPRLFFTEKGFADLRGQIENGENKALIALHQSMMSIADSKGLDCSPLPYDREKMKATYNNTVRKWSERIISAAYAYRLSGDKKYLRACESNILSLAHDFPVYTTDFWLENSEVCMSFGLAYDWLYKSLSSKTKKIIVNAIATIGYDDAADEKKAWFYKATHNWNSVCNATLVCAAIATYEKHPERSAFVIEKALATNPLALRGIYYPEGASHEGPSYWDYASNYQCVLQMELEDIFGTDFALSASPGFEKAGDYRVFAVSNSGRWFNYSDCSTGKSKVCPALWYYAWKFGRKDLLFRDIKNLARSRTSSSRTLYMAIACAQRMGKIEAEAPEKLTLACRGGKVDVLMTRSGWGPKDAYLGLKAGLVRENHTHMDEGSFVFESNGFRWVSEFPHPNYELYRRAHKVLSKKNIKFGYFDEFYRGPLSHSVITVDGKHLNPKGHSVITDIVDTPERRGGTVDFCDCYKGQLESASRSVVIVDGRDLEIRDRLKALPGKSARIRWNLVTEADVETAPDGIILRHKKAAMKLYTSAPGAEFRKWSSNPADYDDIPDLRVLEPDYTKYCHICGFEFDLEAGQEIELVTKIEKI